MNSISWTPSTSGQFYPKAEEYKRML